MERCRIWWPRQQRQPELEPVAARYVMFGWLFPHAGSVDIVVAAFVPEGEILRSFPSLDTLQATILSSDKRMPITLQESAAFTILGDCVMHLPRDFEACCVKEKYQLLQTQAVKTKHSAKNQDSSVVLNGSLGSEDQEQSRNNRKWECDCSVLDGFLDTCKKSVVKGGNWVHFCCKPEKCFKRNVNQIPMLQHLYLDDQNVEINHCHVILYDVPIAGRNHFSQGDDAPHSLKPPFKKPNWICDLQKRPPVLDLDPIVLALNCSNAARVPVAWKTANNSSAAHFLLATVFEALVQLLQHLTGIVLASVLTIVYIFIQLFRKCLSHVSKYSMLQKVFRHSWKNMHLRCCQILYWPVSLQDTSLSSSVNVEYAHKDAIKKHALWSNIIMDLLMGFILGTALLLNMETICSWTFSLLHYMTDAVLRSGCVWLMGVPAGFKLNTELAELLGMISLNVIQIYSTLWFILGGFLKHIIQGLAFSGILLGFTVPVSFFIDIIQLATLHVTLLQWLISLIYSRQIQTVTSLWRLFRGRKWNPLRQRLDSYDYTVEQHVVGSLLFTPVLLLLPTASIFYIFFSILSSTIICLCIVLEIAISIIHCTPYAALFLWVTRRQRFPAGLLFLPVLFSSVSTDDDDALPVEYCSTSASGEKKTDIHVHSVPLVSELNSNYNTLGQVIGPHYQKVFKGIALPFCKQLAHGILRGARLLLISL
ncbi:hypothetical protein QYE76_061530 [Lolium multiflorum]|uniref:Uncharacterized protein n=1 Tax=Lolium multiflorum TaxID=4521 RepID=A0AAD8S3E1_LOLMU|nr:hypothetical protein QYE76_061530 [Lolium multiflorum]